MIQQKCIGCGSNKLKFEETLKQSADFLEPVKGAPYPTLNVREYLIFDYVCQSCGIHWGETCEVRDHVPKDEVEIDSSTGLRVDDPTQYGY